MLYQRQFHDKKIFTDSGKFLKGTAEAMYKYMIQDFNFIEEHMGIYDCEIEVDILARCYRQNKKYTKSRYAGISNFAIKDYELVADPKSHKVMAVRSNVEKWQASQVLKVNYTFDTRIVRTDKEQSVGGYCLFALVDNAWYMTNLLK